MLMQFLTAPMVLSWTDTVSVGLAAACAACFVNSALMMATFIAGRHERLK